jgi:hypothetical protein
MAILAAEPLSTTALVATTQGLNACSGVTQRNALCLLPECVRLPVGVMGGWLLARPVNPQLRKSPCGPALTFRQKLT